MKKILKYNLLFISILLFSLTGCEKEITIDIPESDPELVVEGFIEPGMPPIVFLSKSIGYFAATDISTLQSMMVKDAEVKINLAGEEYPLDQICINTLPDSILPYVSSLTGVSVEQLKLFDYCFYTSINTMIWGKVNETYTLSVNYNEKNYKSTTRIPQPVALDSIWYKKKKSDGSLGILWAKLSDPLGYNAYRIYTKRLGRDDNYIPIWGSVFEDRFFDGKSFDFYFYRGIRANSDDPSDNDSERAYYKEGDTIVLKFCSIDAGVFRFIRDMETEVSNNGNPFAAPTSVKSNISGGALGYWGGYGPVYDTIVAFE